MKTAQIAQAAKLYQDAAIAEQRAALRVSTYLNQLISLRDTGEITQAMLDQVTRQTHRMVTDIEQDYREGVAA